MKLLGPKAKLRWAFEHLKTLDDECTRVIESHPFFITADFDTDRGCHILRFRIRKSLFAPELGLRVGDVVHNGRSALDLAMWAIACRSNDVEWLWESRIARKISFPPVWSEERLPGHPVMPFITDDAKAVLKAMQTHEGGDMARSLYYLDLLWNLDKHRVIHDGVTKVEESGVRFVPGAVDPDDLCNGSPEITWFPPGGLPKDGTKIATVRFRSGLGPPHTQVKVEGHPTALIGFGGGPDVFPVSEIARLLIHVEAALSMLAGLADKAPPSAASTKKG